MKGNIGLLRAKPGYVTMGLHPGLDGRQIVVYAQWASAELLKAAVGDPQTVAAHTDLARWSDGEPSGNVYRVDSAFLPG